MTSPPDLSRHNPDLRQGALLGEFARAALRGEADPLLAPLSVLPGDADAQALGQAPQVDRSEIARALEAENSGYGHPHAAELCAKLADPATRVVVTGQQAGLFGGPLYTLTKALAASLWARRIEEQTGTPAVAVFWIATEDHDYAEVAQAHLPLLAESEVKLSEDTLPLVPVGDRQIGNEPASIFPGWSERLQHRPEALERLERLRAWYAPTQTWGAAFAQLLVAALGDACPLLLDSQLPKLKQLQARWHRRLLTERDAVDGALDLGQRRVEEAGFTPRTRRVPGESPLFFIDDQGARRRICCEGENYNLRGSDEESPCAEGSTEELLALLESAPERFTPGALARALVADAVLGSSVQILGPGEVTYMAEAAPLYDALGVVAPRIAQRPQAVLVPKRHAERVAELAEAGLTPTVLLGSESKVEDALAARAGGDPVSAALPAIEEVLDRLGERCCSLDPHLESPVSKTRSSILGALDKLSSKATASRARQDETLANRAHALREVLLPGGKPQDRVVTAAHFFVEIEDFGDWFAERLELDPRFLQLLALPQ